MLTKTVFLNMKKVKPPVAEYMKIRRYMLNFVEQAGEQSVQAPTIMELSRKFGVSRPTVSKAMKMLTDDGYIIGRPGVGAFTNPAKVNRYQLRHYKNVGILIGDGMLVHYDPYFEALLARILLNLAKENLKATFFQLTSHQYRLAVEEIAMNHFDVLLWMMPSNEMLPAIHELRRQGRRVVLAGLASDDDTGSVFFNYEQFGYRVGRKLIEEGRNKVVYLVDHGGWSRPLAGMKKAYQEAGVALEPGLSFTEATDLWRRLGKLLDSPGKVDTVFSAVCSTSLFLPFYRELSPEIRERVRFIVEEDSCSPDGFSGWLFQTPFQTLADEVSLLIKREIEGVPQDHITKGIEIEFSETNGGQ